MDHQMNMGEHGDSEEMDGCVVRVRGLPWSASQEEVANFLEDCNIVDGVQGVHFTYVRDGRPSGEAYIELASEEDLQKAVSKDKHHMGRRYIEVFRSKKSEMDWVVKRSGPNQTLPNNDAVIRLRGLPFGCSKEEVAHFFSGMEIVPNGITLLQDQQGRTTGDAYVQFASQEISERGLQKHKEKIGHRYIEIFKSSLIEAQTASACGRVGPPAGRGAGGGGMGRMGGGMGGRPSPYDRTDRFGGGGGIGGIGGGGMGGAAGFGGGGRGRGTGNIKGYYEEGFEDYSSGYGSGGSNSFNRGGMGRRGGMGGGGIGGGMGGSMGGGGMGMGGGGMGKGRFGGGYGSGGSGTGIEHESTTGHCVHMRGLPFAANEQDILNFFKPLHPVNVVVHYNSDGRASGEADVDFSTHSESQEALKKDRSLMEHRYIELFLKSAGTTGRQAGGFGTGFGGAADTGYGSGGGYGGMGMGDSGMGGYRGDYGNGYGNTGGMGGSGYGGGGGMSNYSSF